MSVKTMKLKYLTKIAADLFLEKSIGEVTMRDIAVTAEVGEATVYRYFGNKKNLVAKSAVLLQEEVHREFIKLIGGNGYEKVANFYESFYKVYLDHQEYFRFMNELDSYMLNSSSDCMIQLVNDLVSFSEQFFAAYEEGVNDGTLRKIEDIKTTYYATSHALTELCKRLAAGSKMPRPTSDTDAAAEINALAEVILRGIKNQ